MRNKKFMLALLGGGLSVGVWNLTGAEVATLAGGHEEAPDQIAPMSEHNTTVSVTPNLKATALIGMTVRNDAGERLGRLQDIIVNMDYRTVPFAIVERGGTLGIGETRTAVPLADLAWSRDKSQLTLRATKEQFEAASTAPTGGWLALAGEGWVKNVDRYYGNPSAINNPAPLEQPQPAVVSSPRPPAGNSEKELKAPNGQREQPLSDPDKHEAATPTDEYLMGKINGVIRQDVGMEAARNVQVTLKEGLVTLKGKVPSDAQRKLVENQIKVIGGVDRVQNDLIVSNY